jgi:hypothetical protein
MVIYNTIIIQIIDKILVEHRRCDTTTEVILSMI